MQQTMTRCASRPDMELKWLSAPIRLEEISDFTFLHYKLQIRGFPRTDGGTILTRKSFEFDMQQLSTFPGRSEVELTLRSAKLN